MIAIIPARGGSKGLPGKNLRELLGQPLITYTIQAAQKSRYISKIIVSTDSEEIAEVARRENVDVPFLRPDFLASDEAQTLDVVSYTLDKIEQNEGLFFNDVIILQPTSPLRTAAHIDEACEMYFKKSADSVISYCKETHPIFWNKFVEDDGKFSHVFDINNEDKNRQQFKPTYYPNGSIYVFKKELLHSKNLYTDNSFAYKMSNDVSVDIDCLCDFELAEFYMQKKMLVWDNSTS